MRFWDTSAIVALLIEESRSADAFRLLAEDDFILASMLAPLEIASALWRKRHAGELSVSAHDEAERRYAQLSRRWREVAHSPEVVDLARGIVSRHRLRSLDALQLATALFAAGSADRLPIVTFDVRLSDAARAEGFRVLP